MLKRFELNFIIALLRRLSTGFTRAGVSQVWGNNLHTAHEIPYSSLPWPSESGIWIYTYRKYPRYR
jgi:hypothetical protein